MAKTVFIGHPISGDVMRNIKKVLEICARIHTADIIPVVPYIVSLQYLDDSIPKSRDLGIKVNQEYFRRGCIDELWLFGNCISRGVLQEILLAQELDIPIIPKTCGTQRDLSWI